MPTFDDTQLMAYVDGELPAAEAAAITESIASDPALAARIERFAASRRALKQAFALPAAAPLSPALAKLLAAPGSTPPVRQAPRRRPRWPMALAASLVLGLGAVIGYQLTRPAPDALSLALETLPSGELKQTPQGEIVALSTLAVGDDGVCREYDISQGGESRRGLACREAGGSWTDKVLAATSPQPAEDGHYALAGGDVDVAVALKARRLSEAEERQRLKARWR